MPVHRVLVQAEEKVEPVSVAIHFLVADSDSEEDVAAADYRLVGVVGVEVKTAPDEYPSQDVAWGGDALSGFAANR